VKLTTGHTNDIHASTVWVIHISWGWDLLLVEIWMTTLTEFVIAKGVEPSMVIK